MYARNSHTHTHIHTYTHTHTHTHTHTYTQEQVKHINKHHPSTPRQANSNKHNISQTETRIIQDVNLFL